jgi:hypothetical protein
MLACLGLSGQVVPSSEDDRRPVVPGSYDGADVAAGPVPAAWVGRPERWWCWQAARARLEEGVKHSGRVRSDAASQSLQRLQPLGLPERRTKGGKHSEA